jgi:cobalt-zinc-cadmium efflux system outer membrane protein
VNKEEVVMKGVIFLVLAAVCGSFVYCLSDEPSKILDIQTAFQRVLDYSPVLKVVELEIGAKDSLYRQASLFPNPELSITADCLGSRMRSRSCAIGEFTVAVSQSLDVVGRRTARMRVAASDQCLVSWDHEIAKFDLLQKVHHAFIDTAVAQSLLELMDEQKADAEESLCCVQAKIANGKGGLIEEKKAQIACQTLHLACRKAQTQLDVSKKNLAMLWGNSCADFVSVSFPLYQVSCPPPIEELEACLIQVPEILKSQAEVDRASEVVNLERTYRIPDLSLRAAATAYIAQCPATFCVGFDVPLPIFDRNQGNIARAEYERMQSEYRRFDLAQNLKNKLQGLYETWQATYAEVQALQEMILPAAVEAFQMAQESYREGKFNFLEMLEHRKVLFDVNNQYLDAASRYQHLKADIERLIASPIMMPQG